MSSLKSFYDRFPTWIQWIFWCGVIIGLNWVLKEVFEIRELSTLILAGLGTSIFLFLDRPLIRWGIPEAIETGISAVLVLIFLFHLGWTYIAPKLAEEELYSQACNPTSPEMRCYLFSRDNCLMVWNQYYDLCKDEVKKNQDPTRVTSLLGPSIKLCTYKKFDKSFQSTRKMDPSSQCKDHYKKMDEPSL